MKSLSFSRAKGSVIGAILTISCFIPHGNLQAQAQPEGRNLYAEVVAFNQPFYNNRLGTYMPNGMIYALAGDTITNGDGSVSLRKSKRPRPMVLRMNIGDSLTVKFTNSLPNFTTPNWPNTDPLKQPGTSRQIAPTSAGTSPGGSLAQLPAMSETDRVGMHAFGVGLSSKVVGSPADSPPILNDGSNVGINPDSLAAPGQTVYYQWTAQAEGTFLLYSTGDMTTGGTGGGQLAEGLFGAINVEPTTAEYYRSQVTADDLAMASTFNAEGYPKVDYQATYAADYQFPGSTLPKDANYPILNMLKTKGIPTGPNGEAFDAQLVHSDLTALITGPNAGNFKSDNPSNSFTNNVTYPNRFRPFREFTIIYHDNFQTVQAYPEFAAGPLSAGGDFFAINYGIGGIGPIIWANRIGQGAQASAVTAKFEEFFLSSWACADPAMPVDVPANVNYPSAGLSPRDNPGSPGAPGKATYAKYPDDPSNVYHSYMNDHVKFRLLHAGMNITHIHHLHAHQWLRTPASDESHYLDSQTISPGATHTLEMVYEGSGNKNKTVGDSIFHCHFYPHFAGGMWSLWRVHDVLETGTPLEGTNPDWNGWPMVQTSTGKPDGSGKWVRALPDSEIATGTPIPGLVPIPGIPMAPVPGKVMVGQATGPGGVTTNPQGQNIGGIANCYVGDLEKKINPGYPFFIPGVAGQRPPHPPMDFAVDKGVTLNGGLPRHVALYADKVYEKHNLWDFTKEIGEYNENSTHPDKIDPGKLVGVQLPEGGTFPEWVAMTEHAKLYRDTYFPDGTPAVGNPPPSQEQPDAPHGFELNGRPPAQGAPYADPARYLGGAVPPSTTAPRRYQAANIELDVVINRQGYHYPQQRILALWDDASDTISGARSPEPFFFRANSGDLIEYWHANLVPAYYELDDFQVRTPTDVLGQHIHLVKFDVTSSDGAENGFNYEDGTFSPEEVRSLITVMNNAGGIYQPPGSSYQKYSSTTPSPFAWPVIDWTKQDNTLAPVPIADLGDGSNVGQNWVGAQATVQRWYADPLLNNAGDDRTIRTVFTHDHFSPSTHQQAGFYAGLLVEPADTVWLANNTDPDYLSRINSNTPNGQLYEMWKDNDPTKPDTATGIRQDGGPTSWAALINYKEASLVDESYREFALEFQDSQLAYSDKSKNELTEYVAYSSPTLDVPSVAYNGWIDKNAINAPNGTGQPTLITGGSGKGSFSMNYRNELVPERISSAAGAAPGADSWAHVYASINRGTDVLNKQPVAGTPITPTSDFKFPFPFPGAQGTDPYTPLLRAYQGDKVQVRTLVGAQVVNHSFYMKGLRWLFEPSYTDSGWVNAQDMSISEHFEMNFDLPTIPAENNNSQEAVDYYYTASAGIDGADNGVWGIMRSYGKKQDGLPTVASNPNPASGPTFDVEDPSAPVFDVYAITAQQVTTDNGVPVVTMSPAGLISSNTTGYTTPTAILYIRKEDITVTVGDGTITGTLRKDMLVEPLVLRVNSGDHFKIRLHNAIDSSILTGTTIPAEVGINAQVVAYDPSDPGFDVGFNNTKLVPAPDVTTIKPGATLPSTTYSYYAGKVDVDPATNQLVKTPAEFGALGLLPADIYYQQQNGLVGALIVEPKGSKAHPDFRGDNVISRVSANILDNTTGALLFREFVLVVLDDLNPSAIGTVINYASQPLGSSEADGIGMSRSLSDAQIKNDPVTPVVAAGAGVPTVFRIVHPGGNGTDFSFVLHGHAWQEEPWKDGSAVMGFNPKSNWQGSHDRLTPNTSFNVFLHPEHGGGAGGINAVEGDYLYRDFLSSGFKFGWWGIFRVARPGADKVAITAWIPPVAPATTGTLNGRNTVKLGTTTGNSLVTQVSLQIVGGGSTTDYNPTVAADGRWSATIDGAIPGKTVVKVTSANGGFTEYTIPAQTPPALATKKRSATRTRSKTSSQPSQKLLDLVRPSRARQLKRATKK